MIVLSCHSERSGAKRNEGKESPATVRPLGFLILEILRLRSTPPRMTDRTCRRDKTRHAALPCFHLPAILEPESLADDRFPTIGQGSEVLPHGCQGHVHLLGDLQVQALAVLFQALQGFGHRDMSSEKEKLQLCREKKRPRELGVSRFGVPTGIRTPVIAVKGRCPRPLDDGD